MPEACRSCRSGWVRLGSIWDVPMVGESLPPVVRWSLLMFGTSRYCRATRSRGPWTQRCLSTWRWSSESQRCVSPSPLGLAGDTGMGPLQWWRRPSLRGSCRVRSERCGLSLFLPWLVLCGGRWARYWTWMPERRPRMVVRIGGSPAGAMSAVVARLFVVRAMRGVAVGGSGASSTGRRPDLYLGSGRAAFAIGPW